MSQPLCPVCGTPGRACGDDHLTAPVITSELIKGGPAVADAPLELKQYEYYVGHMKITAQMTEAQAEKVGAKPIGEAVDDPEGGVQNKEAERASTQMAAAEESGVTGDDPEALNKARETRNRRSR